jgi:hypothetical protein
VKLDRAAITVGEKVSLTLEVVAASGVRITMPALDETLGAFAVRERRTPPDIPEGDRRRWSHLYVLDTFAAGDQEIPALTVRFEDQRVEATGAGGAPIEGEIVTDPFVVPVASVLADDVQETDFRDIRAAIDVPVERAAGSRLAWIGGLILLVVTAIIVWIWIRRRRARVTALAEPPVPAHDWARQQLAALEADDLVGQQRFHEFYFRLSDIVRQYIERRFGLMAPERTTEEFLREAERSDLLSIGHRELLRSFLHAADLVKFARHEPTVTEAGEALAGARAFVDQTAPTEVADGTAPGREAAA